VLATLGIFGAALFFGDSMITPAISVLSAVEGLKVVESSLEELVVPITAVIIVVLFVVQRRGTAAIGRMFGPVMIAWFSAIGACGVVGIVNHPAILKALSPTYALDFMSGISAPRALAGEDRLQFRPDALELCVAGDLDGGGVQGAEAQDGGCPVLGEVDRAAQGRFPAGRCRVWEL
jgi:hypothetical protein